MRNVTRATPVALLLSGLFTFVLPTPAAAQISGRVTYTGTESGKIFVEAFTESDATFEKLQASMINPGPFSFPSVEDGSYHVIAYIDADDDERIDPDEIWVESGSPVTVPPGDSNIVLDLDSFGADAEEGDGAGGTDGCCAIVGSEHQTPWLLVVGASAMMLFRRRRPLKIATCRPLHP